MLISKFLIEMLELHNHGSHDHIHNIIWINFVGHVMGRSYDVIAFISKYLYFSKAWGSHFCWHHKIVTFFIKKIFKDSTKVKRTKNFVSKCNLYMFFFLICKICWILVNNCWCQQDSWDVLRDSWIFWICFR